MTSDLTSAAPGVSIRPTPAVTGVVMVAAFAYIVILGGTSLGETDTVLRAVNAALGGGLIAWYLIRAPGDLDRIDRGVLLALVAYLAACVLSALPRQSFDAALSAFSYVAAFSIARRQLANVRVRSLLMYVFIGLSCLLTLMAGYRWLVPMIEWLAATGWRIAPPLNLELAAYPWGHRHDLTLAIALLYPAWWAGRPSPLRRASAIAFGVLGVLIVLVDGSRTMWLALGLASALVLVPPAVKRWRGEWMTFRVIAMASLVVVAVLIGTGLGAALAQRAVNLASLGFRAAMWGPLADVWLTRPLSGSGPGSFPWVLQQTSYFDTNSWAPRHPDNAAVQMLAEGGLLGLAAMAILLIVLLPPVLRSRFIAARWAVVAFGIATVGANPTDFGFLVVIAIAWGAYALPRAPMDREPSTGRVQPRRLAAVVALGVIAVAYGSTLLASARYDAARLAIRQDNDQAAREALDDAVALDPGMALYPRQRGALELLMGDTRLAIQDLRAATRLNPWDDLAWRTLAVGLDAAGDGAAAAEAVDRAVEIQRSDPTNLLLLAALNRDEAPPESTVRTLAEVVQAWPSVVFSPAWGGVLPESMDLADVVREAANRWEEDRPIPETPYDQGLWLAVMSSRPGLVPEAIGRSQLDPAFAQARLRAIGCDAATMSYLERMDHPNAAQSPLYWHLRFRSSLVRGDVDERAARIAALMHAPISIAAATSDPVTVPLNPLNENGQFSGDLWGYRRQPISWPDAGPPLPSPSAGMTRWFYVPSDAVLDAGLGEAMPDCAGAVSRR